jgi:hypothetical protein
LPNLDTPIPVKKEDFILLGARINDHRMAKKKEGGG